ncbi:MAG TPA: ABC transporter permease [Dehalococcoidia bacterium]|nr:ABC transporter permease [Dehalococcoidia bacterium]
MATFIELTRAYLRSFVREPSAVIFSFAIPVLFIAVFGLIFGNQGTPHYALGVVEQQAGPNADRLVQALQQVPIFKIHHGDEQTELKRLGHGDRAAVVIVPDALDQPGQPAAVQVYADPGSTAAQSVVLPVLRQVVDGFDRQLAGTPARVTLEARSTSAQNSRYIDYLVPSILAMSLMQLGLYSAVTLVTQRESKLLRRLGATPLRRGTLVASQVAQRVLISVIQAVILIGVGKLFFHVDFTRDLPALLFFIVLGTLAFVAMGFVVGAFAGSAESAMPLVQFIALPMLFLSGIFFEIDAGPAFLQPVARALPLTYLGDALRQSTVHVAALNPLWVDAAVLAGWLVASFAVSVRLFRWE